MLRTTNLTKLELWRERFVQFGQGKQTVQQFCESVRCSPATFYYWQRKLDVKEHAEARLGVGKASAFVPVVLRGSVSSPVKVRAVKVRANDGTRIAVPVDALAALEIVLRHTRQVAG